MKKKERKGDANCIPQSITGFHIYRASLAKYLGSIFWLYSGFNLAMDLGTRGVLREGKITLMQLSKCQFFFAREREPDTARARRLLESTVTVHEWTEFSWRRVRLFSTPRRTVTEVTAAPSPSSLSERSFKRMSLFCLQAITMRAFYSMYGCSLPLKLSIHLCFV